MLLKEKTESKQFWRGGGKSMDHLEFHCFKCFDDSPPSWLTTCVITQCPPLCDLIDYTPSISFVHGILQARIPEWVAISFSRGSSCPRDQTCVFSVSCIGRWILLHLSSFTSMVPNEG